MKRREDWQSRLSGVVRGAKSKSFKWGEFDCVLFTADCIKAVTGNDPASDIRGKYTTAAGALRQIRKRGANLMDAVASVLTCPCDPCYARRGDVIMFDGGNGPTLGVCVGDKIAAVSDGVGLVGAPMSLAEQAWRVG